MKIRNAVQQQAIENHRNVLRAQLEELKDVQPCTAKRNDTKKAIVVDGVVIVAGSYEVINTDGKVISVSQEDIDAGHWVRV